VTELAPISTGQSASPGGLEAILKHRLMSDDYQRIELITGTVRRRHWTTGTEAADHRGEFPAWVDRIVGRPPARHGRPAPV
jgi:hypothetical protein